MKSEHFNCFQWPEGISVAFWHGFYFHRSSVLHSVKNSFSCWVVRKRTIAKSDDDVKMRFQHTFPAVVVYFPSSKWASKRNQQKRWMTWTKWMANARIEHKEHFSNIKEIDLNFINLRFINSIWPESICILTHYGISDEKRKKFYFSFASIVPLPFDTISLPFFLFLLYSFGMYQPSNLDDNLADEFTSRTHLIDWSFCALWLGLKKKIRIKTEKRNRECAKRWQRQRRR